MADFILHLLLFAAVAAAFVVEEGKDGKLH